MRHCRGSCGPKKQQIWGKVVGKEDNVCWKQPFSHATRQLGMLQGTAGAGSRDKVPPLPPSILFSLRWHTATMLCVTTGTQQQHQRKELQVFPTHTPNLRCCTSHISPCSFLENSILQMIGDKNLDGCSPELYVSNSHFHQNRSYF